MRNEQEVEVTQKNNWQVSPDSGKFSDLFFESPAYKPTVSAAQLCSTTNVYVTIGKYSFN